MAITSQDPFRSSSTTHSAFYNQCKAPNRFGFLSASQTSVIGKLQFSSACGVVASLKKTRELGSSKCLNIQLSIAVGIISGSKISYQSGSLERITYQTFMRSITTSNTCYMQNISQLNELNDDGLLGLLNASWSSLQRFE